MDPGATSTSHSTLGWQRKRSRMSALHTLCDQVIEAAEQPTSDAADVAVAELIKRLRSDTDATQRVEISVLQALRSGRHLEQLKILAEALSGFGHTDPHVRILKAQGYIDTGAPSTAIDILKRVKVDEIGETIQIEVDGLIGRAFKDLFLLAECAKDARANSLLNLSIQSYADAFRRSDETNFWVGENLLALYRKARRTDIAALTRKIMKAVTTTPEPERDYWHWATLAICHISDDAWDKAGEAMRLALSSEGANAFALGGTIRQLTDWWDIEGSGEAGAGLLIALQTRLLQLSNGHVRLTGSQLQSAHRVSDEHFERVFGANGPRARTWLLQFLKTGTAVGQIIETLGGGVGTCFIVDGAEFHPSLEGERLILTNEHVVSPFPEQYTSNPPLRVNKAAVRFEVFSENNGPCEIAAKEIIWSSPAQDHDACLIRLAQPLPEALPPLPIVRYAPLVNPDGGTGVYVIGHPGGRTLAYSMQNNELLDHNCKSGTEDNTPRFLHYTTPTEPGSSGSPAMNEDLDVVGLHHAGGKYMRRLDGQDGTYSANEAVWIDAICRAAAADLEAGRTRYQG